MRTGEARVYHASKRGAPPKFHIVKLSLQPAVCNCGVPDVDQKICMHVCYAHEKWRNPAKKSLQEYLYPWQHAERWRAQYAAAGDFPLPSIADIDRNCDDAEFNLPIAHPQPRGRPRTKRKRVRSELFKQKLKQLKAERSNRATAASSAADDDDDEGEEPNGDSPPSSPPASDDDDDEGEEPNDDSPPSSPPASPIVGATSRMSSNGPPASNTRNHVSREAAQNFSALPNSSCIMSSPASSRHGPGRGRSRSRPLQNQQAALHDQPLCLIHNCLARTQEVLPSAHTCGACGRSPLHGVCCAREQRKALGEHSFICTDCRRLGRPLGN